MKYAYAHWHIHRHFAERLRREYRAHRRGRARIIRVLCDIYICVDVSARVYGLIKIRRFRYGVSRCAVRRKQSAVRRQLRMSVGKSEFRSAALSAEYVDRVMRAVERHGIEMLTVRADRDRALYALHAAHERKGLGKTFIRHAAPYRAAARYAEHSVDIVARRTAVADSAERRELQPIVYRMDLSTIVIVPAYYVYKGVARSRIRRPRRADRLGLIPAHNGKQQLFRIVDLDGAR